MGNGRSTMEFRRASAGLDQLNWLAILAAKTRPRASLKCQRKPAMM